MTIYLLIFVILACLSLAEISTGGWRHQKYIYWISVALLIVFAGLRGDGVGFDYESYANLYETVPKSQNTIIEPAFRLLIVALSNMGGFQLLLITCAISSIGIKSFFIEKYAPYTFVGLLVYFSVTFLIGDMGQIRYGLAVALVLLSYHFMMQDKKWWSFAVCVVAILFHYSALIVLPMFLFVNKNISSRTILVTTLCSFVFYFLSINDILVFISKFIPIPYIQGKIHFYTFYTDTYGKSLGINISLLLRLFILFLVVRFRGTLAVSYPNFYKLVNLYFYGVILYMVFSSNSEFATRGSGFFKILEIALLPILITLGKNKSDKLLIWLCTVAYCLHSIIKVFDADFGADDYMNYTNILFE